MLIAQYFQIDTGKNCVIIHGQSTENCFPDNQLKFNYKISPRDGHGIQTMANLVMRALNSHRDRGLPWQPVKVPRRVRLSNIPFRRGCLAS